MITVNSQAAINSPVRSIRVKVELFDGSTLLNTFRTTDRLINLSIERIGEDSKFFGFGISQRLNLHLIDKERELDIPTSNSLKVYFSSDGVNYVCANPLFYVSRVNRDENTNELSITAYDKLSNASKHTVNEVPLTESFTLRAYATACAEVLGLPLKVIGADAAFDTEYPVANYNGSEDLRTVLDDIAEVTQTVYYMDNEEKLVFRRLDKDGAADIEITKAKYITLKSGANKRLARLCSTTELGENFETALSVTGSTQYIHENGFLSLNDDTPTRLEEALAAIGGITINQFDCSWRGNYLVEYGDKLALTTKDNEIVFAYLLNDVLEYDGSLKQSTIWNYSSENGDVTGNPTTIGEKLKNTSAKVDKVNQTITSIIERTDDLQSSVTSLQLTTEDIAASVSETNKKVDEQTGAIAELTDKVNATMTPDAIKIEIQKELAQNGAAKVTTSTGFTFNEEGLTVSKTGSEMNTTITDDGMTVYRDNTAVLTANNKGVTAIDLHAKTYLWVGTNSRLENYGPNRTGCFWVG